MNILTVSPSPHVKDNMSTQRIMLCVIASLLPAVIASGIIFGLRALMLIAVCILSCIIFEAVTRIIMKKEQTIGDLSAVLRLHRRLFRRNLCAGTFNRRYLLNCQKNHFSCNTNCIYRYCCFAESYRRKRRTVSGTCRRSYSGCVLHGDRLRYNSCYSNRKAYFWNWLRYNNIPYKTIRQLSGRRFILNTSYEYSNALY